MEHIGEAIWKAIGEKPGKRVMILGGTHGNEKTGIEVVKQLVKELQVEAGEVVVALGNLKAIEMNERGTTQHNDLNRSFPPNLLERETLDTYEDQRARELAQHMKVSDVVIDLHATNKPSEPFLACLDSDAHRELYQWFTCDKVLADPNYVLGGSPVTTDEFTESHGGIGICYETGLSSDTSRIEEVKTDVLNLLRHLGIVSGTSVREDSSQKEVYEIIAAIIRGEEDFDYVGAFGDCSWTPYKKGDIIGHHGTEPLEMDDDGVIVFPTPKKFCPVGKPIGYLAKRVN